MKRVLLILAGLIIVIGIIGSLDFFVAAVLNSLIFIMVLGVVGYLIYYFFFLTESQRKYKRALRKSKRTHKNRRTNKKI
ncbi:SA1362 family protein [Aliicoccus persicus]|uniref:Uncharacterized protein n=1 Tax=Aliicoccus persicus TaxID=930138 RepID=A0A662Z113_9STAP|nr:SA1362 family protein [Aliicoccus persicus]SEV84417.1 hypothetical protein SAMN05192557_0422 [Aliicoccus persicus]